jgi:hypothetical protein
MNTTQPNNEDYYMLPDGRIVFTAQYHLKRGYCCGNACKHCPYQYENVSEPKRSLLLNKQNEKKQ